MIAADVTEWQGGPFDAVLVDAPCSSTGTIRRHPDVAWLKSEADIAQLIGLQRRLLDRAVALTKPGGRHRLLRLLARARGRRAADRGAARARAERCAASRSSAGEIAGIAEFVTPAGDLRTLPCHWAQIQRSAHGRARRLLRGPAGADLTFTFSPQLASTRRRRYLADSWRES